VGAWGAGSPFPSPRSNYHSETADIQNTNNITGLKDKRVDELIERYDISFDTNERAELLKKLDGILASQYIYTLRWYDPAQRVVFWNKFGMPEGSFSRVGDYNGTLLPGIPQLWWVDPEKSQKVAQAMRDNSIRLEVPPVDDRYWQERFGQAQKELEAQPSNP
jgi:microcin C transport system substrate-binding protein